MTEVARQIDWTHLPYEHRIYINGPTTAVYSAGNLPFSSDPGWSSWQDADGKVVKMINIHGPFAIQGHEDSDRCEDGWLAVDESGFIFSVESEYIKPSTLSSELEERARPHNYKEIT
jgi:hypothetical protein